MSFVRSKKVKGLSYLYRVESYREGKRVRQRVLAYLGKADDMRAGSKAKKKKPAKKKVAAKRRRK